MDNSRSPVETLAM